MVLGDRLLRFEWLRAEDKFVLAIEIGGKHEAVGVPFTCVFAVSDDMINRQLLDMPG